MNVDEKKFYYIMYSAWFIAFVAVWFVLSRISVPGNGNGAGAVGKQLTNAQSTATAITERIEKAEQRADSIRERTGRIESIVVSTGDTIKDSQRILEGIRRRGKVEAVKN